MIQLTISRPGTLMPVTVRQEITPAQESIVAAILRHPGLTYDEVLDFLRDHDHRVALEQDASYLDFLAAQRF